MLFPYRMPDGSDRAALSRDGNYIGGMLIVFVTLISFLMSAVALVLVRVGVIARADVSAEDLGLGNTRFVLLQGVLYALSVGLPALFGLRFYQKPTESSPTLPMKARDTASLLVVGLGGCMGVNFVSAYVAMILENLGIPQAEGVQAMEATPQSLLLNVVVLALLPAVLEELMFRVCILQTLRRYGDRLAILLSAVLFGVMHGGIAQSVFACMVGLLFGWITVTTGSPRCAILLHFVNNAISVVMQYAALRLPETAAMLFNAVVLYGLLLAGIVTLAVSIARRAPFWKLPPRGELNPGFCVRQLWKTPLMPIATVLILLRVAQFIVLG